MIAVFWDRKGVLIVEFMQQRITATSEVYCKTPKELHEAIQNKRHGMLTYSVVLLYDSVRLHAAARTQGLLEHLNLVLFDHIPYSPDLALNDYHLFTYLKNWLRSHCVKNNEEFMEDVRHG
jgi:hypothetical protein